MQIIFTGNWHKPRQYLSRRYPKSWIVGTLEGFIATPLNREQTMWDIRLWSQSTKELHKHELILDEQPCKRLMETEKSQILRKLYL